MQICGFSASLLDPDHRSRCQELSCSRMSWLLADSASLFGSEPAAAPGRSWGEIIHRECETFHLENLQTQPLCSLRRCLNTNDCHHRRNPGGCSGGYDSRCQHGIPPPLVQFRANSVVAVASDHKVSVEAHQRLLVTMDR